jgi:inorganic pyrophosphatase
VIIEKIFRILPMYKSYLGKTVIVVMDRILGSKHPSHPDIIYAVNYGYIPHTTSGDGMEIDFYVLGPTEPLKEFTGTVIAIIHRLDDVEDKLVVSDSTFTEKEIIELTKFQEKYFKIELIMK